MLDVETRRTNLFEDQPTHRMYDEDDGYLQRLVLLIFADLKIPSKYLANYQVIHLIILPVSHVKEQSLGKVVYSRQTIGRTRKKL